MVINIMAQNSDSEVKKSDAKDSCPSVILNAIPRNYKKIQFSQLKAGENYKDTAIIGKISRVNPLGKNANGHIRKLLITDALSSSNENQKNLPVFLLYEYAEDSEAAQLNVFIIITNFLIEKSTHKNQNEYPLQLLLKKGESQVLYGKKTPQPAKSVKNNKQTAKKRKQAVPNGVEDEQVILANQYDYTKLGDLQETEPKTSFNVFGIVDKCSLKVTQGKKTQILEVVITDESEIGFTCSIFGGKDETYPDIYPGDIIRIHRMQVCKFRSRLKGKCLSPKFILVFSKNNDGSKPKTVAKSFTYNAEDSARVRELFQWYNKKSEPKIISEINRGDFANIICQVIGVYCAKTTDAVILKIWDGTKTNQFESAHWGLKEEKLDEKLFLIAKNYYVVLSVYGQHAPAAAELKPGQFIEVRDAHLYSPKLNPDDCKLCLHTGTKEDRGIKVLDLEDDRVKNLKLRLEKIFSDTQTFGNETDHLLSQNNSIFLNCDISAFASSQKSTENPEENVDMEALNRPLSSTDDSMIQLQNTVISVVDAAIKPGQCTQEFGENTQRDMQEMDNSEENETVPTAQDPLLNKTPMEFRMFLHNPSGQSSPSFFPIANDTEEEWWNAVATVSETVGNSHIKPSSISEIIQHDAPYKFRSLCVILSCKPETTTMLKIIHLYCPKCLFMTNDAMPSFGPFMEQDGLFYFYCPECSKEADKQNRPILEYTFLLTFDLHDGTGPSGLEVHLWKEHAVAFFKGITPKQALSDRTACDAVFQMLWNICPNFRPYNPSEARENSYTSYPILDCCIMSYITSKGTFYQMFETELK